MSFLKLSKVCCTLICSLFWILTSRRRREVIRIVGSNFHFSSSFRAAGGEVEGSGEESLQESESKETFL